ncbi:MAG: hypothetical protein JWR52_627 [Marmoricola sp.]|nr:hypothetical protein [Marmoricola sp.]
MSKDASAALDLMQVEQRVRLRNEAGTERVETW